MQPVLSGAAALRRSGKPPVDNAVTFAAVHNDPHVSNADSIKYILQDWRMRNQCSVIFEHNRIRRKFDIRPIYPRHKKTASSRKRGGCFPA
ncbi:hypothetical protein Bxe_B2166 [Paraburkholderia xenovorans LB400]|uniref:Uncharacterized protein n=1 Tax=Paraburkholderia xenovorans (strain LB400) TaxID=266265 RepID=Q13Q19_PARXL|nr:hypothetical protein Bxe_B2166 [Paraburkholderia xenovorans LB400]